MITPMSKTADRIRSAAARLFAERGYAGTSVRAICTAAEANVNAVSYHFGGKQALYIAIIQSMGDERLASAQRILGTPAQNLPEVETRLLLFAEETLAALLTEPELLSILLAESQQGFRNCGEAAIAGLAKQNQVLIAFLRAATEAGLLRRDVDIDIVAGTLIERLNNQVIHVQMIHAQYGTSITAPEYRQHWTRQTIGLLLHGAAQAPVV